MKWKHKSWITVWLILVCAALLVTGTYAAYTRVEYVKRVVATKDTLQSERFSSNHLLLRSDGNEYPIRMIPVGTQSDVSVMVTVCNYLQSDITQVNEETITYTFSAQLVDMRGDPIKSDTQFSYEVEGETAPRVITGNDLANIIKINENAFSVSADGITYSPPGSETLPGGVETAMFYRITCPQEKIPVLDFVAIRMKADPGENRKKLVGELRLGTNFQQLTAWNGRFLGLPESDSASTKDYDGFNYEIYGMKQQQLTICWNPNRVSPGKWSLEQFDPKPSVQTDSGGWNYIEVTVGQPETPMSYTLQFYRVGEIQETETVSTVVDGTTDEAAYVFLGDSA